MKSTSSFSLQSVLDVRQSERQQRRTELADALRRDAALELAERKVRGQVAECESALSESLHAGLLDLRRLAEIESDRAACFARLAELHAQRKLVAHEIDERRNTLVEADRQVKAIERLRIRRETESLRQGRVREAEELWQATRRAA